MKIEIPADVEIALDGGVRIKGKLGEVGEAFKLGKLKLRQENNLIFVEAEKATKREKRLAGTVVGKIKNMVKGVREGFTYKLQVASSHFPMRVEIDKSKGLLFVKNFLGERIPRQAKLLQGVDVKIEGDMITVTSANKEAAGQVATNIEGATKVKAKDKRIFMDGIYLIERP